MNKTAAHRSIARRAFLTKAAGIATDYLATLPSQALASSGIPVVSQLAALTNMGGSLGGLITDPKKEKNPKTDALSLVPGVGSYRLSQRYRRVMDESNRRGARGTANLVAEAVGPITSSIIGAGAGGALGGVLGSLRRDALGRTKAGPGAAVGAIAGGVLPVLVGSIAAGIRRKRTLDEQAAADTKGRVVAKYLVPGLSQYDSLKRLGASSHLDDKSKKTDTKEKKAAEAAFAEGFCKAAETLGVDPGALAEHMAVKKADLTRKNALRWLLRLGGQSGTGRVRTRITEIGGRLRDVGRLSPQVDENLTQMGDIARRLEEYTAARGAAGGWIGKPDWVGSTLPKGKKLLPQLIEDAGPGLSSGLRDSARSVLKSVGYIK